MFPVNDIAALRGALGEWFLRHKRKMPWRDEPSLYRTVVSEFMLQQTRVDTVRPYFARWVARWPGFGALASASEAEVVNAWEGLGYYSRARNLRKLAIAVAALPVPPRSAKDWADLPGVGPYTAAAIASIACGEAIAVVDGNVVRVLSRLVADERVFKDNGVAVKAFRALAQTLLDTADPGNHNQAMMELGALVCLPRSPLCIVCPLVRFCAGVKGGIPEDIPRFAPRKIEKVEISRLWIVHKGCLLLHRHGVGARRLSGLHELPAAEVLAGVPLNAVPFAIRHRAISNQQITETIYRSEWTSVLAKCITAESGLVWVPIRNLASITLSGPHRKWLSELMVP
jgi:A/G-specific adenine glycosylase